LPDDVYYRGNIKARGYKEQELEAKTKVDMYLREVVPEKVK
jgi:hypothetical protein